MYRISLINNVFFFNNRTLCFKKRRAVEMIEHFHNPLLHIYLITHLLNVLLPCWRWSLWMLLP